MSKLLEDKEKNQFHVRLLQNALICLDLVPSSINDYEYIAEVKLFLSEFANYLDENTDFSDENVKKAFIQKILNEEQDSIITHGTKNNVPTGIDRLFMFEARMHAWPADFSPTRYSADAILMAANIFRLACSMADVSIARPSLYHIYDDSIKAQKDFVVKEKDDSPAIEIDGAIKHRLTRNFLKQGYVDTESRLIVDCHKIGVAFNGVSIRPMVLVTKPLYDLFL